VTNIAFTLAQAEHVELSIFNVRGQLIEMICNNPMPAGLHTIRWDASNLPNGIFICRMTAGHLSTTLKLLLTQ